MEACCPADLPDIDAVEICVLDNAVENSRAGLDTGFRKYTILASTTISGAEAQTAARLWRALPAGETARCHIPPFGLRFFQQQQPVLQASLCWQCNNVFMRVGDASHSFGFDAGSMPARELLALCKRLSAFE